MGRALFWLFMGLGMGIAADAAWQLLRPNQLTQPVTIDIRSGERFHEVLDDLERTGVFGSPRQTLYAALSARLSGQATLLKAGEYEVPPHTTPMQTLTMLAEGRYVLHEIRLVEGWKFAQAWTVISSDPNLHHVLPTSAKPEDVMRAMGHPGQPAEGRFFPDTYRFPKGETDISFLRRAYEAMDHELLGAWTLRDPGLPYPTPQAALIMASLVEKETALPTERPRVAGVLVRRLSTGMKLQTDPSVIYGLGGAYAGVIHTADLRADTPFNTYTRDGLPPTPICLPGRTSIDAAMHPTAEKSLYFVSRGDGSHAFADTLEEHDANVRRFELSGVHASATGHAGEAGAPGAATSAPPGKAP